MISETPKRRVAPATRLPYASSVPLEAWNGSGRSTLPEGNFLQWIIDAKLILAEDCSMLQMLGWGMFSIFQEAWQTGYYDPSIFDRRIPAWLRMGDYRVYLSMDGNSLTVQKGNKYGHFIDVQGFDGDWMKLGAGLKALGIDRAPYPASRGKVAAHLLQELVRPLKANAPVEAISAAWQACKGSRMEALSFGTIQGVAYDISSAFPFVASKLPWGQCEWVESKEWRSDAFYGFALVDIDIPTDLRAGPLAVRISDTHQDDTGLRFPVGKVRVNTSQPEMLLLKEMGIPFTIKSGWWGYPVQDIYPFEELMGMLWELRGYDKAGAKGLSVACVGQLGSVIDDGGPKYQARSFFNPIYFAHIYADTRCRVYRKAMEVGLDNVCAFTIDGIITIGAGLSAVPGGSVDPGNNRSFGDWRKESEGAYFIANDYFKDRPDEPPRWREAVENTPQDVAESRFQVVLDNYVSIRAAMERPVLRTKLGSSFEVVEDLPLGSDHRIMPKGLTRKDFLAGMVEARL